MTRKTKGRAGCNQATSKTSKCAYYFKLFASHIKAEIVTLALWGWLAMCLFTWFYNLGEAMR